MLGIMAPPVSNDFQSTYGALKNANFVQGSTLSAGVGSLHLPRRRNTMPQDESLDLDLLLPFLKPIHKAAKLWIRRLAQFYRGNQETASTSATSLASALVTLIDAKSPLPPLVTVSSSSNVSSCSSNMVEAASMGDVFVSRTATSQDSLESLGEIFQEGMEVNAVPDSNVTASESSAHPSLHLKELLFYVLSPANLFRFDEHLDAMGEDNIAPHTRRRAYSAVARLVRRISGGKHFMRVQPQWRRVLSASLNTLSDLMTNLNARSNEAISRTESKKIHHLLQRTQAPLFNVRGVYRLFVQERNAFFHDATEEKLTVQHTGFCVLAASLGRPNSRAALLSALPYDEMVASAYDMTQQMGCTVVKHKSMSAYGCMLCQFHDLARPVLAVYMLQIRPILLATLPADEWNQPKERFLFPLTVSKYLRNFLATTGFPDFTLSQLRTCVVQDMQTLSQDAVWGPLLPELQQTSGHGVSQAMRTIQLSYAVNMKSRREQILNRYVNSRYFKSAVTAAETVLGGRALPMYPMPAKPPTLQLVPPTCPPSSRKRRRRQRLSPTINQASAVRICRNAKRRCVLACVCVCV